MTTVHFLMSDSGSARVLSDAQVQQFIRDGFVKIEAAFPRDVADQCRSILWRDTGCNEGDPATWMEAVIRLGMYGQEPFARLRTRQSCTKHLINLSVRGDGCAVRISGRFRSGFPPLTIQATRAGTSIPASRLRPSIQVTS